MKNQIKELRVQIDGLAQLIKELKPIKQTIIDNDHFIRCFEKNIISNSFHIIKNVNSKEIEKQ
jgi:hypothetical protein